MMRGRHYALSPLSLGGERMSKPDAVKDLKAQ